MLHYLRVVVLIPSSRSAELVTPSVVGVTVAPDERHRAALRGLAQHCRVGPALDGLEVHRAGQRRTVVGSLAHWPPR